MQATIISLLVIGMILFVSTFFMNQKEENPDSKEETSKAVFTEEEKQSLIENASIEIVEITQDKIEGAKDELEKISNEKLMAVGEFSDTVLGEMDKTHKEIMFLYNMLNEKEAEIKKLMQEKTNQAKLSKEEMDSVKHTLRENGEIQKEEKKNAAPKTEPREEDNIPFNVSTEEKSNSSKRKTSKGRATSSKNVKDSQKETRQENNNEKIISLYQKGDSVVEIAKKLNLGKGEVKLVIDLFSQEKE